MRSLGRQVEAPSRYDPDVLEPIPRQAGRDSLGLGPGGLPFGGEDIWRGWELSWLEQGAPRVAVMRLAVPCDSPGLVESKSVKLYLYSLNQENFADANAVRERIVQDIGAAAGAPVSVELLAPDDAALSPSIPPGECVDALEPVAGASTGAPEPGLLQASPGTGRQQLYSHCLRTLCPVTGQPDWASVLVDMEGAALKPASLLGYLASFRLHREFHEQCVERIFVDIQQCCAPAELSVQALFTRRGGLDISPFRCSSGAHAPRLRTFRQ